MRALALVAPGRVQVVEREIPILAPTEVLVRINAVGICGSDLSVFFGHRKVPHLPWIMGHEGVGVIAALGELVQDRKVGQRVVVEPNYCCMKCGNCLSGVTSGCVNRVIIGMTTPGLLAEYVAVPSNFAWLAPSGLDLEELVCLEPLAVGEAATRRAEVSSRDKALVVGAGSTGLLLIAHLIERGNETYVVEPHAGRASLAVFLGAKLHDAKFLYDQVFETSGSASGTESAIRFAGPGATVTLLGLSMDPASIVPAEIVRKRLRIIGSMIYDHPCDFASTMSSPPKNISRVIRGKFDLEQAQEAYLAARDVPGKSWIFISDQGANN